MEAYIFFIVGIAVSFTLWITGDLSTFLRKYPSSITFVRQRSIGLFDEVLKTFPNLDVNYNNIQIEKNLVLIKGSFINSGKHDLTLSDIEKPITLILPDSYEWLEANIVSKSSELKAEVIITDNSSMIVKTKLFRKNEFIRFQALVSVPENEVITNKDNKLEQSLYQKLKIEHRIANTGKIKTIKLHNHDKKKARKEIWLSVFAFFMLSLASAFTYYIDAPHQRLVYQYNISKEESIEVTIAPKNGVLLVTGFDTDYRSSESTENFFKNISTTPVVKVNDNTKWVLIISSIINSLIFPFFAALSYHKSLKNKKLMRTLKLLEA